MILYKVTNPVKGVYLSGLFSQMCVQRSPIGGQSLHHNGDRTWIEVQHIPWGYSLRVSELLTLCAGLGVLCGLCRVPVVMSGWRTVAGLLEGVCAVRW